VADSSFFDKHSRKIIYIIFFASGICGLAYEVIWVRILGLTLGNSIYAVSLVVAAFMAGLGLGSFLAGRFIENKTDPLRIYAYLELGVGIFALCSPFLLGLLSPIYVWVGQNLIPSSLILNLFRFALAFIVLLVPTIFMGATLPVLSKYYIRKQAEIGTGIAWLYGVNTLGAMAGCLATGFILIEKLGVSGTISVIATVNFAIAAVILLFGRKQTLNAITDIPRERTKESDKSFPPAILIAVLIAFALSGFASISYEVIWTRALGYFVGHTTYAFTSILAAFLFGIGFGSLLISKFADRAKRLLIILGITEIAIGITAALGMPLLGKAFYMMESAFGKRTWATPIGIKFIYAFLIMLLPTLLMGMTFPMASKIYVSIKKLGSQIGNIYAVNTIGGIMGSFAAALLFIPLVGMQTSIMIIAYINFLVGAILIGLAPGSKSSRKGMLVAAGLAIMLVAVIVAPTRQAYSVINRIKRGQSIYYKEGLNNTIEILRRADGVLDLYIDGELNASTSKSGMLVHRLLAQLPLLLHPEPKSIFLVGLGSGMTAGAALSFDAVRTIKCAEISNDIVEAAEQFAQWNHDILKSSKFDLEIEDGRIALLTGQQKYDVMITGIIHPKYNPGNAGLYSRDYYEQCKSRLSVDGIMCQWIPLNALRDSEFKMIIATFQSAFPHTSLWFEELFGGDGDYNAVLIGSLQPLKIDYDKIQKMMQNNELANDFHSVEIADIGGLLNRFMLADSDLSIFAGPRPLISDNRPRLEFGTVESKDFPKILATLGINKKIVTPYLVNLPTSPEERARIEDTLLRLRRMAQACIAGDVYLRQDRPKDYIAQYQAAAAIAPENEALQAQLASLRSPGSNSQTSNTYSLQRARELAALGELSEAIAIYEQLSEAEPGRTDVRSDLGMLYQKAGKTDQAIQQFQKVLERDPANLDIHNNLGIAYMQNGIYVKAENEFLTILRIKPDYVQAEVNLGLTYARTGRKDEAIQMLEKALVMEPDNANIKKVLEQLKK